MRRMRCCLSSRSTVDLRSRAALAGVDAIAESSRNHGAARSLVSFCISDRPPELMTDAVTQPVPPPLEFLCKARPRTQFDEPWISNLKAAEQAPVGA